MHDTTARPSTPGAPRAAASHAVTDADTPPVGTDRRTRLRLRELCDEVLASWRVAAERDLFSSEDRMAARRLVPLPR